jgi:hypothetical protein
VASGKQASAVGRGPSSDDVPGVGTAPIYGIVTPAQNYSSILGYAQLTANRLTIPDGQGGWRTATVPDSATRAQFAAVLLSEQGVDNIGQMGDPPVTLSSSSTTPGSPGTSALRAGAPGSNGRAGRALGTAGAGAGPDVGPISPSDNQWNQCLNLSKNVGRTTRQYKAGLQKYWQMVGNAFSYNFETGQWSVRDLKTAIAIDQQGLAASRCATRWTLWRRGSTRTTAGSSTRGRRL